MITWMTRMSFLDTAEDLSTDLLVQGIQESHQLFEDLLTGVERDDPTARIWQGFERALGAYSMSLGVELSRRGVRSARHLSTIALFREWNRGARGDIPEFEHPPWLFDTDVLRAHRSNLVRRWPGDFADSWTKTPELWPYLWPFVDEDGSYALYLSKHDKELLRTGARKLPADVKKKVANL